MTTFELAVVCAVLGVVAALVVIPWYAQYARARQVDDAAAILAQDIVYLERIAQNSAPYEGATIEVESNDPLVYTCYLGRPTRMDPQSHIRAVLRSRSFPEVELTTGPLDKKSPLLFAHDGSMQYVAGHQWAGQHQPASIILTSRVVRSHSTIVQLDPFTGAVTIVRGQ